MSSIDKEVQGSLKSDSETSQKSMDQLDCGPKIKLISGDEIEFVVPLSITNLSATIKNAVADTGDLHASEQSLPLPNVDAKTLKKVVLWLSYHSLNPVSYANTAAAEENEKEIRRPKYTPKISGWDAEYCQSIKEDAVFSGIWPVMIAANYLQIEPLMRVLANFIRSLLKGPNDDDYDEFDDAKIREVFGLKEIYDDKQEEKIRTAVTARINNIVAAIPAEEMIDASAS